MAKADPFKLKYTTPTAKLEATAATSPLLMPNVHHHQHSDKMATVFLQEQETVRKRL